MDLKKAADIVQKRYPLLIIRACSEYDTFYLFTLAPIYIHNSDEYVTGTVFPAVDKKTGKIFQYDITSDYEAFEKTKKVI